jgi:tetratricopeptide (TPR) repeat protein
MDWDRYNELLELRDSGHVEEAMAEFDKLGDLESDPLNKSLVLMAIANGLRQLKRFSDARGKISAACALLGPKHEYYPRAAFQDAVLDVDEGHWKVALKKLDRILEKHSPVLQGDDHKDLFEEVQRQRGIALSKLGQFQEARPILESLRLVEYDRIATLAYLGVCNFELKDYNATMEVTQQLLSLNPGPVFRSYAHYHRGVILFQREQLARAKSEFEECLACSDRGDILEENLLEWIVDTCKGLNLTEEAARYSDMLKKVRGAPLTR